MIDGADFTIDEANGGRRLALSGNYLVSTIAGVDRRLREVDGPLDSIDLSAVREIDTVGTWVALGVARRTGARVTGASERAERLIEALAGTEAEGDVAPDRLPFFARVSSGVGDRVFAAGRGTTNAVGFIGQFLLAAGTLIRHPRRFRTTAFVRQLELVGVSALGIIGLMSFLIGIVIAQQGAVQLQQFGAESLTVNLVGRITLRELGVLMTAIMVAGRSGSAFAAQIGTMKLTEEVDAMRTIGISPMEALVMPRVLAVTFMMIMLGFYSSCMAIIGGAVVGELALGIPFGTFLARVKDVVPIYDLWVGLVKAPVFGLIVGMTGCYQGMKVKGNSEEVGLRTTNAVVFAIFTVIVLDAFFAVFFTNIGWA
ncbi:MlaE family lipid ABC transporter permease subunit [Altererythrobacter aerius]|uniref:MlaE family lipid ABC transporter permease subunit n=1 Tax=Tsuneonella aeria TaxID=1837929 RepID=A0A6I4TC79_9SPHN|nr:ABC transporter permease [Tsuneonella aeria]MXO74653.1 MlaE family lipid ABC transporter permease subunit [Tsuneonella aeria]